MADIVKDINNIPKLHAGFDAMLNRIAQKAGAYMESRLVNMIVEQNPQWTPLKPATTRQKGSSKIYIDTGELMNLITYQIEGIMPKTVKVGIFNHEKGMIAHFMEFGTRNMPERPLFRLVFDMEEQKVLRLIQTELYKELQKFTI